MLSRQTSKWLQAAKQPKIERTQSQVILMKTEKKARESLVTRAPNNYDDWR